MAGKRRTRNPNSTESIDPYGAMNISLKSNCKGNERKESSKMLKHFYRDKYKTRKEEDIGMGKDMRNSYRIAQNLATFNAIPKWKCQSTSNIKLRTNSIGMGSPSSDVDMTIHDREEVRTNSIVIGSRRDSDRDTTIHKEEVTTNTMVMSSCRNGEGIMSINKSPFSKHKKEQAAIQEILEELMYHRCVLESYQKQNKKVNYENEEEETTKGQCISKKIELFLDSCEEMMKMTQFDECEKDECYGISTGKNENMKQQKKLNYYPCRKEIKWSSCMIPDTTKTKKVRFDIENTTYI